MGACWGWPDLEIIFPTGGTLFVELKNPKGTGRVDLRQQAVHTALRSRGLQVEVIASYEKFKEVVNEAAKS